MSNHYEIDRDRLLDDFLEMVRIDSPSRDERKMADWLIEKFRDLGCEVEEDDTGDKIDGNAGNLRVTLPGNTKGVDTLLFSAHMDTVEPARGIEPVIGDDDVIRSKGETILGADDKAGLAAILHLARLAQKYPDVPRPDLEFSIHVAEEVGLLGAKHVDTSKFKAKLAYILDDHHPNVVCIGSPGAVRITYRIFGKAAHAGLEPEKGINAIKVASEAITNMTLGRIDEETTANIGTINGGTASNVITEKVEMKAEARSHDTAKLDKQVAHMNKCFEDACAKYRKEGSDLPKLEVDRKDDYAAVRFSRDDYPIKLAMASGKELGWEMDTQISGGGTDGSVLTHKGIPSVVLGVGMMDVHSTDEWIEIGEMVKAAELAASIVENHAAGKVS